MTSPDGHRVVALVVCYERAYVQRDAGLADVKTDLLLKILRGDHASPPSSKKCASPIDSFLRHRPVYVARRQLSELSANGKLTFNRGSLWSNFGWPVIRSQWHPSTPARWRTGTR